MSSMVGADLEQVRALAASFDRAAAQLNQTSATVRNGIQISAWAGPFADPVPPDLGVRALGQAAAGRERAGRPGQAAQVGGRPARAC